MVKKREGNIRGEGEIEGKRRGQVERKRNRAEEKRLVELEGKEKKTIKR